MYGYRNWSVGVIVAPAVEPVTVEQARANSRIDAADEDDLIELWIQAAREVVERETRRKLVTQTLRLTLDRFPVGRRLLLPGTPLQSVVQIAYDDQAGDEQIVDVANYRADPGAAPGRVVLSPGLLWPCPSREAGAVRVDYVAGYGDPSAVPAALRSAILLMVGDMYEHREAQLEQSLTPNAAVRRLLTPFILKEFA